MKEICVYKSKYQIWRLLISDKNKLLIEERDTENKEVYFSCIDLQTVAEVFSQKQFDEKYWIGIEAIYKEIIYLHKFNKPDMPGHKGIVAFDIESQKVLWKNDDYNFLFVDNDMVYTFTQQFESRKHFRLNYLTGELIDELELDSVQVNQLKQNSFSTEKFKDYIFPEPYSKNDYSDSENNIVNETIQNKEIVGTVELAKYDDLLLFNYYYKNKNGLLTNKFNVINAVSNKVEFEKILFENANAFVPDSFFIKENFLFILNEKNAVLIYRL